MKNNVIKLNESALRKIVAESVKRVLLKESSKEELLSQIYEYVDEYGKEASGGKVVFFRRGATDNEGNELIYLWIDENGKLTLCSNLDGQEHCDYLSHYQDSEILSIFNMLRGHEQYSIPSESTFQKVYDLYHYLDGGAYKESDATRELRDMISGWLNKQSQGEMNAAIGG